MPDRSHQLETVVVGDDPSAWTQAGFTVHHGEVRVGQTTIELVGSGGDRGILSAALAGAIGTVDGMPFIGATSSTRAPEPPAHANLVVELDHLVAMSPDMDRTTTALRDAGLDHRRTRRFESRGGARRQEFFWLGDVILELAGDDVAHGPGHATLWGIAFTATDFIAAAERLGEHLGPPKPAVQRGREIATLRTSELDISIPIVLMTPHPQIL